MLIDTDKLRAECGAVESEAHKTAALQHLEAVILHADAVTSWVASGREQDARNRAEHAAE